MLYPMMEGLRYLLRSRLTGFITILSLIVALGLISVIGVLYQTSRVSMARSQNQTTLWVYFDPGQDTKQNVNVANQMKTLEYVDNVRFIPKAEGLVEYQQQFDAEIDIKSALEFNPLPDAVEITVKGVPLDGNLVRRVSASIRKLDPNTDIVAKYEQIQKKKQVFDTLIRFLGIGSVLIIFVTVILIYNTIRLSIHSRKDIINAMFLVGAKPSFIKRPFLFEGIFQCLIAFAVIAGLTHFGVNTLNTGTDYMLKLLEVPVQIHRFHYYLLISFAFVICYLASWISVTRSIRYR